MAYKSKRLLLEAITKEMDAIRKLLTQLGTDITENSQLMMSRRVSDAHESLNDLRKLFDEVVARLEKPSIDDLAEMKAADYVEAMMPLVTRYHQQLMAADMLVSCLCADLEAFGAVIILVGNGQTLVRAAHHPEHPEVALAMEAILTSIDEGTKKVVADGTAEAQRILGLAEDQQDLADTPVSDLPDDSDLRIRYADPIQEQDLERNRKASFIVDANGTVIKDRVGSCPRPATQEEIDSCLLVKEPGDE